VSLPRRLGRQNPAKLVSFRGTTGDTGRRAPLEVPQGKMDRAKATLLDGLVPDGFARAVFVGLVRCCLVGVLGRHDASPGLVSEKAGVAAVAYAHPNRTVTARSGRPSLWRFLVGSDGVWVAVFFLAAMRQFPPLRCWDAGGAPVASPAQGSTVTSTPPTNPGNSEVISQFGGGVSLPPARPRAANPLVSRGGWKGRLACASVH
jgi:hypothetical protein